VVTVWYTTRVQNVFKNLKAISKFWALGRWHEANFVLKIHKYCRSQWPRGLRRRSAAVRLLRLWIQIPPGAWMSVCCECRVLLGRGLCDELITRSEESYQLCCVVICNLETSWMRRPWAAGGCNVKGERYSQILGLTVLNFSLRRPCRHLFTLEVGFILLRLYAINSATYYFICLKTSLISGTIFGEEVLTTAQPVPKSALFAHVTVTYNKIKLTYIKETRNLRPIVYHCFLCVRCQTISGFWLSRLFLLLFFHLAVHCWDNTLKYLKRGQDMYFTPFCVHVALIILNVLA